MRTIPNDFHVFLAVHTQLETAKHYGVSDRTIRNWLAATPSSVPPRRRMVRRAIKRPALRGYGVRSRIEQARVAQGWLPLAPGLVARLGTQWRNWQLEWCHPVPGTRSEDWNTEQENILHRRRVPVVPQKAELSGDVEPSFPVVAIELPEVSASLATPLPAYLPETPQTIVRIMYRESPRGGLLDWLRVNVLGPGPVLAFLVLAVLLLLMYHS